MFYSYLDFGQNFLSFEGVFNRIKDKNIKKEIFEEFGKIFKSIEKDDKKNYIRKLIDYNLFYFLTKDEIKDFFEKNSKNDNVFLLNKILTFDYNEPKTLTFDDVVEYYEYFEQKKQNIKHLDILNYNKNKKFDDKNIELFLSEDNNNYFSNSKNKPLLHNFLKNNNLSTIQLKKVFFRGNYYYVDDLEMLKEIIKLNLENYKKITTINDELLTYENIIKLDKKEFLNIVEHYDLNEEIIGKLLKTDKTLILKSLYIYKNKDLSLKDIEYIENKKILTEKEIINSKRLNIDEKQKLLDKYNECINNVDEKIKKKGISDVNFLIKKQTLSDNQIKDIILLKNTTITNTLIKNQEINENLIKTYFKNLPTLLLLEYQNLSESLLKDLLEKNSFTTFKQFIFIMNQSKYKKLNTLITEKYVNFKNKDLKYTNKNLKNKNNFFNIQYTDTKIKNKQNLFDDSMIEYPFLESSNISQYIKTKDNNLKSLPNDICFKENISTEDMTKLLENNLFKIKNITSNYNFFIKNKDKDILNRIYLILKKSDVLGNSNYNSENYLFITMLNLAIIEVFTRKGLEINKDYSYKIRSDGFNISTNYSFSPANFIELKKTSIFNISEDAISLY